MDSYSQQQLYDSTDILLINDNHNNAASNNNNNNTSPSSKNSWDNIQGDSNNSMENNDEDEYFTWNSLKIDESNLEDGSSSANNVVIDQGHNSNNSGANNNSNNSQNQNQKVPIVASRKRKLLSTTNDVNIPLQNKTLRQVATNSGYKLHHQEALNHHGNIGDQQPGQNKHGGQLLMRKTGVQGGAVKMPQWHVDDIGELEGDIDSSLSLDSDLANNSYNVGDSILSISGLQVFKQEVPSPTNHDGTAPSHAHNLQQIMVRQQQQQQNRLQQQSPTSTQQNPHHQQQQQQQQQQMSMSLDNLNQNSLCQNVAGSSSALDDSAANSQQNLMINNTISQLLNQTTAYTNLQNALDSAAANLVTTTGNVVQNVTSQQQDNYGGVSSTNYVFTEDCRFQYVLAAATSIATKVNEDTLTYLNQGQSYEIKLKKLGDLSMYRGKLLKSVIRICFHERRLQFMEREQMALWQRARPGDRILEVDVPLSYGAFDIVQPANALNFVHFNWDPTKEVGVYIKVNCISTEFTPKKHGGEKGVPFRIQVETYQNGENFHVTSSMSTYMRLHAAACQIKVFKLKGADRKHKQDREKIMKRPISEQEKYQPSYECTVLNDIPNEAVLNSAPIRPISPAERGTPPKPLHQQLLSQFNNSSTPPIINRKITNDNNEADASEIEKVAPILSNNPGGRVESPNCSPSSSGGGSPGNVVEKKPDPGTTDYIDDRQLSSYLSPEQTSAWLLKNRFEKYSQVFENFCGSDMMRMSREDLIQICGHADGIRLFNSIHMKSIMPKLKLYVSRSDKTTLFNVVYLSAHSKIELKEKLGQLVNLTAEQVHDVYMEGPKAIHVQLTNDVIAHLKDESMFSLDVLQEGNVRILLLKLLSSSTSSSSNSRQ